MADGQENIRHNLNRITAEEKERRISALRANTAFTFVSFKPVTEKCHFERYNFMCENNKLNVVYDTKAQMLSFTAKPDVLARVPLSGFGQPAAEQQKAKEKPKPAEQKKSAKQPKPAAHPDPIEKPNVDRTAKPAQPPKPAKQQKNDRQTKPVAGMNAAPAGAAEPAESKKKTKADKKAEKQAKQQQKKQEKTAAKAPVTTKAVPAGKKTSEADKPVKPPVKPAKSDKQAADKADKQAVGKTDKPIKGRNKAARESASVPDKKLLRNLKKLLPNAFDLLGDQSVLNLCNGLANIYNEEVKLSDYSGLLLAPYRALECFIHDLQQARGISVKMIGQAYEKDERGNYRLKLSYRRKTGVVYAEVMSALYTEYFEKRNFYLHADNATDSWENRVIAQKSAAKEIFDGLCEILDYNGKKLKETGFSVSDKA